MPQNGKNKKIFFAELKSYYHLLHLQKYRHLNVPICTRRLPVAKVGWRESVMAVHGVLWRPKYVVTIIEGEHYGYDLRHDNYM